MIYNLVWKLGLRYLISVVLTFIVVYYCHGCGWICSAIVILKGVCWLCRVDSMSMMSDVALRLIRKVLVSEHVGTVQNCVY